MAEIHNPSGTKLKNKAITAIIIITDIKPPLNKKLNKKSAIYNTPLLIFFNKQLAAFNLYNFNFRIFVYVIAKADNIHAFTVN